MQLDIILLFTVVYIYIYIYKYIQWCNNPISNSVVENVTPRLRLYFVPFIQVTIPFRYMFDFKFSSGPSKNIAIVFACTIRDILLE